MKKIASVLRLDFLPTSTDLALLILRLWIGLSMLLLHGWDKLSGYKKLADSFMDPLRLGNEVSFWLAVFGEVVCSIFLVLGFFTRFAALGGVITMGVAFFLVHGMELKSGRGAELAFLYMAGFVAILLAGPGRFALDGRSSKPVKKAKLAKD